MLFHCPLVGSQATDFTRLSNPRRVSISGQPDEFTEPVSMLHCGTQNTTLDEEIIFTILGNPAGVLVSVCTPSEILTEHLFCAAHHTGVLEDLRDESALIPTFGHAVSSTRTLTASPHLHPF